MGSARADALTGRVEDAVTRIPAPQAGNKNGSTPARWLVEQGSRGIHVRSASDRLPVSDLPAPGGAGTAVLSPLRGT
jgi:hypothetical protein